MLKQFFPQDKSYLILVPTVLYHCIPKMQTFISGYMPFFFCVIFLLYTWATQKNKISDVVARRYFQKALLFYFIYVFIPPLYSLFQHGDSKVGLAQAINNIALFCVLYMSIVRRKFQELEFLTYVAFVGFFIAGIASLRAASLYEIETARDIMAGQGMVSIELQLKAQELLGLGLGGYTFTYVCAFLMPVLVLSAIIVKLWIYRMFLCGVALSLFICVKNGGLGTPLLIMVFGMVLILLWVFIRKPIAIATGGVLGCIAIGFLMFAPSVLKPLHYPLKFVAENMEKGQIQHRFETLSEAVEGDKNSYAFNRYQLQRRSLETFLKNPFFGAGAYENKSLSSNAMKMHYSIGWHSFFFDMLGCRGLFGSLPYYLFLLFMLKYVKRLSLLLWGGQWFNIFSLYLVLYVFGGISNPVPYIPATFYIILPGIALIGCRIAQRKRFVQVSRLSNIPIEDIKFVG